MNDQLPTATPAAFLSGGADWLTLPFTLIALGILFALFILFWGARLAMRRRQARAELERRGEAHFIGDPMPTPAAPPKPEIASEPPVAAGPIAAAAPLDASPAALAADLPGSAPEAADASGDDLTRMKGVGPKLAEKLNALGITSFARLAAMTPAEAATLDAGLGNFQGRIHRDRWIEQARFLATNDTAGYEATFGKL